ncbi:MAG: hypothetical protein HW421_2680 [Ignavibacteria bacterium]|nr:hypothetical protein [Ignavibacteria bacterium]
MPKLKQLSGKKLIKIMAILGFEVYSQKGSHIKLKKTTVSKQEQTITIPNHPELDKGTIKAIIRQLSQYISIDEINEEFYTKEK